MKTGAIYSVMLKIRNSSKYFFCKAGGYFSVNRLKYRGEVTVQTRGVAARMGSADRGWGGVHFAQ